QAVVAVAIHQIPHRRQWLEGEVAAAAVLRLPRPAGDRFELQHRAVLEQQGPLALTGHAQAAQAEVGRPALDQDSVERVGHHRLQEGDVLADELFLQADVVGGNDDAALLAGQGRLDGWHYVGETVVGRDHRPSRQEEMAWRINGEALSGNRWDALDSGN